MVGKGVKPYKTDEEEQEDLNSFGLYSEKDSSEWERKKYAKDLDRQKSEKKYQKKKKRGKLSSPKRLPQNKHRWIKEIEHQWKLMSEQDELDND